MSDFRFPAAAGGPAAEAPGPEAFDDVLNAFTANHDHSWKAGSDPEASFVLDEIGGSLKLNALGTSFFGQPRQDNPLDPYEMFSRGGSSNKFFSDAGVDASGDFTLAFWKRQYTLILGTFPFFAQVYKDGSNNHLLMRRSDTSFQNLYYRLADGTTVCTVDKMYVGDLQKKLLVMRRSGTTCSIWVNGEKVAEGAEPGPIMVMDGAIIYIADYQGGGGVNHDAFYGQINFWSAAISDEAIASLWNDGHGRYYVAP